MLAAGDAVVDVVVDGVVDDVDDVADVDDGDDGAIVAVVDVVADGAMVEVVDLDDVAEEVQVRDLRWSPAPGELDDHEMPTRDAPSVAAWADD